MIKHAAYLLWIEWHLTRNRNPKANPSCRAV